MKSLVRVALVVVAFALIGGCTYCRKGADHGAETPCERFTFSCPDGYVPCD